MPTTTMAVSSPQNSTSSSINTQVIGDAAEKTDDDTSEILKAAVNNNNNNNNLKNGAISSLLTNDNCSPKITLHSPISIRTNVTNDIDIELNIKSTDVNCLNVVTSSPNSTTNFLNNTNGHPMLMEQNSGMNFPAGSSENSSLVINDWSIGEDNCNTNNAFASYSSHNNGQILKRSIVNPQMHHGLSPNSNVNRNNIQHHQQQQYIHSNKNNSNSGNNFPQWSNNSASNSSWQHQIPLLQPNSTSQGPLNPVWNRGRSGGNSLSNHGLNHHQQQQQLYHRKQFPASSVASSSQNQSQGGLSPNLNSSPSKYRRSTSYPNKNQMHGFNMDVGGMTEDQPYMNYNDRNNMDMRSLEHCLNDIANTSNVQSDMKGFLNSTPTLQSLAQLQGKLDFHEFIPGKPFYQCDETTETNCESGGNFLENSLQIGSPARSSPSQGSDNGERFSRKVFVGGLPPDIDEDEITSSFRRYGPLVVDWPHKAESKSYFPPKGYAFLLFQDESSVQTLIENCIVEEDKLYICVSSPTIKNKPVQIRPWRLSDADFVLNGSMPLDPRKTVFVGGVPRPLKALELAMIMDRLYGGVCYAGIDTDPELKYPKGAGRVAFSNQQSYIAAISARFVQLQHNDIDKRVEVKPYVLDDQMCDECQGQRCSGKFAPFFCANVTCLQYYCEHCWATIHARPGREYHKPLVKEGADRPRAVPFRWC
ncbi:cytoplasmic polyadenylation element-binding protein 2 isoform X1 [Chironomus tepperi]|uniref:cytoplasmic polyadenylation element-binding protein 2 isoform X1 n=1 Tax=Chironomus tepperi TaxID=113505 RepID=UPI00391F5A24